MPLNNKHRLLFVDDEESILNSLRRLFRNTDYEKIGFSQELMQYRDSEWNQTEKDAYRMHPRSGQDMVRFIKKLDHVGVMLRTHQETCAHHQERAHCSGCQSFSITPPALRSRMPFLTELSAGLVLSGSKLSGYKSSSLL
jgi:DNA-binding NtrC family response regulator